MKVTAIMKGRTDQNGQQPIQIRIAHEGRRVFKPTQIKVAPSQFKGGRITGHPRAEEWNKTIDRLIIQYQADMLHGFDKKAPRTRLVDYAAARIKHLDREPATFRQYDVQIAKLKEFEPDAVLAAVNHDYFNRYKVFLKKRGNDNNTVWNSFKFLKKIIHHALSDGLLKTDPRLNYEFPKYTDPTKTFLTYEEVKLIDKFIRKAIPADLKEVATWYLIGCYSGLRISDIIAFNRATHIVSGRLVYQQTQKTGEAIGLPVRGKLKECLEMVKYKPLSVHPNTYNKLLKVMASAVGIRKHLHAHTSRHTAAMMLADAGVTQEVAAKILGIRSLKTLNVYYKISNKRIDLELKNLKHR